MTFDGGFVSMCSMEHSITVTKPIRLFHDAIVDTYVTFLRR